MRGGVMRTFVRFATVALVAVLISATVAISARGATKAAPGDATIVAPMYNADPGGGGLGDCSIWNAGEEKWLGDYKFRCWCHFDDEGYLVCECVVIEYCPCRGGSAAAGGETVAVTASRTGP